MIIHMHDNTHVDFMKGKLEIQEQKNGKSMCASKYSDTQSKRRNACPVVSTTSEPFENKEKLARIYRVLGNTDVLDICEILNNSSPLGVTEIAELLYEKKTGKPLKDLDPKKFLSLVGAVSRYLKQMENAGIIINNKDSSKGRKKSLYLNDSIRAYLFSGEQKRL